jgi:hypothetical protein
MTIVYTFETIEEIASNFDARLDDDIIQKLLDIKRNNIFIKRRAPLRLKYQIHSTNTWRKDGEGDAKFSPTEYLTNLLVSNLNKLSNKNYDIIFKEIQDIYRKTVLDITTSKSGSNEIVSQNIFESLDEYENDFRKVELIVLQTIVEKAMNEQNYSEIYAQLVKDIQDTHLIEGVSKYIIDMCDQFYVENIGKSVEQLSNNMDYDKLCELYATKTKFIGGFIFIANLFKFDLLSYDIVKKYFDGLIEYFNNSPAQYADKYLDTIISVLSNCGKELELSTDKDKFYDDFMKLVFEIKDKNTVKGKYKFKLLDLIELYENKWANDKSWTSTLKKK